MPNAWSNKVLAGVGGGSTASKTHEAKAELALGYFYSQLFFCIGRVTTKSPAAYLPSRPVHISGLTVVFIFGSKGIMASLD